MFTRRSFRRKAGAARAASGLDISACSRRWTSSSAHCSSEFARTIHLRDNTFIVLCSDNGPEGGAGSAGPFRGSKGTLYEGGIRSPLIVWGPGFIKYDFAGKTNTTSVLAAMDLAPSLLEIAGVAKPSGVEFDGQAFADVLLGSSHASRSWPALFPSPARSPW